MITRTLWSELKQLPSSEKTEAVFLSRFGNRLDRHAIHRLIKKAVEKAGINPHTSAHWLRHAHACHSLSNGAGIELLMKSLGHSSLAVTSRYLHVKPSECTRRVYRFGLGKGDRYINERAFLTLVETFFRSVIVKIAGCNLRLLQQSLGHASVTTTERYLHISPDAGSSQFINF